MIKYTILVDRHRIKDFEVLAPLKYSQLEDIKRDFCRSQGIGITGVEIVRVATQDDIRGQ